MRSGPLVPFALCVVVACAPVPADPPRSDDAAPPEDHPLPLERDVTDPLQDAAPATMDAGTRLDAADEAHPIDATRDALDATRDALDAARDGSGPPDRRDVVAPRDATDVVPAAALLQAVVARLGAECARFTPGTRCGMSVRDLASGASAHHAGDERFVSASAVKAVWVAAAVHEVSIAAVMPYAAPIFARSDNHASGRVIDLLASPDRINAFMWDQAGMRTSGYCSWPYPASAPRRASTCPVPPGRNHFTANDGVSFLTRLYERRLLAADRTAAVLDWMTLSPDTGYGGWLGTQLPREARATLRHKAGWIPPDVSNDFGIVQVSPSRAYAVAILMSHPTGSLAAFNTRQLPMLEYASCVIYHAVARDVTDPFGSCRPP